MGMSNLVVHVGGTYPYGFYRVKIARGEMAGGKSPRLVST